MSAHGPTLAAVIKDLRRLAATLERLTARDGRPLDAQILDALAAAGPLTTAAVRRLVSRRQSDVLSTLRLMAEAGRIRRNDGRWSLVEE